MKYGDGSLFVKRWNDNKRYHGGWSEINLIQEVTFKKEESWDEYCGCRFRGHWWVVCDGS